MKSITRSFRAAARAPVLAALLLAAGNAGAQGFNEQFDSPTLDPAWQVVAYTGPRVYGYPLPANDFSLAANPGHLRYTLSPMTYHQGFLTSYQPAVNYYSCCPHDPGLELHRAFTGEDWLFESKVTTYMPFTNGRSFQNIVYFGDGGPNPTYSVNFYRWRDGNSDAFAVTLYHWPGTTLFDMSVVETFSQNTDLNPTQTFYHRLERQGSVLTATWSPDGVTWNPAFSRDMGTALDGLGQRVVLAGISWFSTGGSYADHDYVTLTPIDRIPPTIVAASTAPPNPLGWYNGDVNVHFTCTDTDSGIPEGACPEDQVLSAEGAAVQSTPQTVADTAGNVSEPSDVVTVSIDRTAPSVSLVGGPADGGSYGYGSLPAAPSCAASDALSDLVAACDVSGYATNLGSHTVIATATDRADNQNSASATYAVIAAAPVITPVLTGTLGLNGWYTSNVGLTWTLVSASPITAQAGCQVRTVKSNTVGLTYTCFAQNETGTSGLSVTIKRDASPPTVTAPAKPGANSAGWRRTTTTVTFVCSDGTSGILSCPAAIALTNEGTAQGASGTGFNNAGLQTTATATGINIDLTAPTVLITVPINGAAYPRGSSVAASYTCSDTLSGIATCAGPVANGAPINTVTRGTKKFQVTGTDRAGNTTKTIYSYTVQ